MRGFSDRLLGAAHLANEEFDEAIRWAEDYRKDQPECSKGIELLCFAYFLAERWQNVASLCEEAYPDQEVSKGFVAEMASYSYCRLGKYDRSRWWCNQSLALDSDNPETYYLLAAIEYLSGNLKGYHEALGKVLDMDPDAATKIPRFIESMEKAAGGGESATDDSE